jgi:hypothetical protein
MTDDTPENLVALFPDKTNPVNNSISDDQKDSEGLLKAVLKQQPEAVQITYMVDGSVRSVCSNQPFHTLATLYGYSQLHFINNLGRSTDTLIVERNEEDDEVE